MRAADSEHCLLLRHPSQTNAQSRSPNPEHADLEKRSSDAHGVLNWRHRPHDSNDGNAENTNSRHCNHGNRSIDQSSKRDRQWLKRSSWLEEPTCFFPISTWPVVVTLYTANVKRVGYMVTT